MDSRPTRIRIERLRESRNGSMHRVSADVDGTEVWFESPDVELRAAPEAFGSAFLIPALQRGARLSVAAAACTTWRTNLESLLPILDRWWGLPQLLPSVRVLRAAEPAPATPRTGLCFSAGIDSFYSLLRSGKPIDSLITVQGFDVTLEDSARMTALWGSQNQVASQLGLETIRLRTNLRAHPLVQAVPWERAHGGALVAIGHVLDPSLDRLLISSSIVQADTPEPWGSHWQTDPLWSSSRLRVLNIGSELLRTAKLQAIAAEPLVREHLQVCWEHRTASGNCSRCEKCLVARLKLAELDMLDAFPGFEGSRHLAAHVDAHPCIRQLPRAFGQLVDSTTLPEDTRNAVRRLVRRTRSTASLPRRVGRYLTTQARSLLAMRDR